MAKRNPFLNMDIGELFLFHLIHSTHFTYDMKWRHIMAMTTTITTTTRTAAGNDNPFNYAII